MSNSVRLTALTPRYWIAVMSEDESNVARQQGFCQFGRGHARPAQDLREGDGVLLYSRNSSRRDGSVINRFSAIGQVVMGDAYVVTNYGREQWRRDVQWFDATSVHLADVASMLHVIARHPRRELLTPQGRARIDADDFACLARAMQAKVPVSMLLEIIEQRGHLLESAQAHSALQPARAAGVAAPPHAITPKTPVTATTSPKPSSSTFEPRDERWLQAFDWSDPVKH